MELGWSGCFGEEAAGTTHPNTPESSLEVPTTLGLRHSPHSPPPPAGQAHCQGWPPGSWLRHKDKDTKVVRDGAEEWGREDTLDEVGTGQISDATHPCIGPPVHLSQLLPYPHAPARGWAEAWTGALSLTLTAQLTAQWPQ